MLSLSPRRLRSLLVPCAALVAPVALAQVQAPTVFRPDDGIDDPQYGACVAIDGDVAVVTALHDDDAGLRTGSAWVLEHDGTSWSATAKLLASDASPEDRLGWGCDVEGGTIVVGPQHPAGVSVGAEHVYVFEKVAGTWTETARVTGGQTRTGDLFGRNAILVGDVLVVSAMTADTAAGRDKGELYVFRRVGGAWTEEQRIEAPSAPASSGFAEMVAFDGRSLLATASFAWPSGGGGVGVHAFRHDGAQWTQHQWISPPETEAAG